jgi:hypothetical protein
MNTTKHSFALVALIGAIGVACGSNPVETDPLVGKWTWSGPAPGPTTLTITFSAEKTFIFDEQVAPGSEPAGYMPNGCITTELLHGTYAEMVSEAADDLTWAFTDGTANQVTECNNPSENSAGTPMTSDGVASYIEQGHLPPTALTFHATASTLLLSSTDTSTAGVARGAGTTFTRVP